MQHKWLASLFFGVFLFPYIHGYLNKEGICTRQEITCSTSCSSVAYCMGDGVMPLLQGCYGSTPYCNMGNCTRSYNPNCNQQYNPLFYCPMEDGTYPDPHDCTRFHICMKGRPYSAYCASPGLVYSTKTFSCVRESMENQCGKVDCNNNSMWALYTADNRYAFLCRNSMAINVIRCKENHVFNLDTGRCEFKCNREGLFPAEDRNTFSNMYERRLNIGDNSSYIECSLLYGREYLATKRNCPNDEYVSSIFDPETSQCEYKPPNPGNDTYSTYRPTPLDPSTLQTTLVPN